MVNRLHAVAEGILQERGEIGGVVMGPQPGRAVVRAAVGEIGLVKGDDLGPGARLETPMTARVGIGLRGFVDRQEGVVVLQGAAAHAVADGVRPVVDLVDAEAAVVAS